jgi:hypothetical protein
VAEQDRFRTRPAELVELTVTDAGGYLSDDNLMRPRLRKVYVVHFEQRGVSRRHYNLRG